MGAVASISGEIVTRSPHAVRGPSLLWPPKKQSSGSMAWLPALLLGYALGSIAFGLLLGKGAGKGGIREIGSGNIGGTNVLRTGSKGLAAAVLLLDSAKGYLAVWLAARWFVNAADS